MDSKRFKLFAFLIVATIIVLIVPVVSAENTSLRTSSTNLTTTTIVSPAELFISVDPIGNHTIDEVFFINGTTNLPLSEKLTVEIIGYDWLISPKTKSGGLQVPSGRYANIPDISILSAISGTNRWSVNVTDDVKELANGDYYVGAYSKSGPLKTPQIFTLFPINNSTTVNVVQTTVQKPSPIQSSVSDQIVSPTKQAASLPIALPIAALMAIVIMKPLIWKKSTH
jgi:hypothetical protein